MPMYNLIDYSDSYSKISGRLWQFYGDEPPLGDNNVITDFPANNNNSNSFKFKQKITGETNNNWAKDVEIVVSLKYLSNFWRTLEVPLINCEISLMLTWSKSCFLMVGTLKNKNPKFTTTVTKLYVPVATFSTQDNIKLLKQL